MGSRHDVVEPLLMRESPSGEKCDLLADMGQVLCKEVLGFVFCWDRLRSDVRYFEEHLVTNRLLKAAVAEEGLVRSGMHRACLHP